MYVFTISLLLLQILRQKSRTRDHQLLQTFFSRPATLIPLIRLKTTGYVEQQTDTLTHIQKRVHGSQHTLRLFIVPFISLSISLPQLDFIRISNLQTSLPKSSRFCFSRFNAPQRARGKT
ncbi:hypothetical protein R6Q59_004791 [Mikania micrantha]